jgi:hypothetical protein
MSETNPSEAPPSMTQAVPAGVLEYNAPREYRSTGHLNPVGLFIVIGGGLVAGVISAGVAYAWISAKLPSLLFLPMLAQGGIVAFVLVKLIRKTNMRNRQIAICIGVFCGVASAFCFQGIVYLKSVYALERSAIAAFEQNGQSLNTPAAQHVLARLRANRFSTFDQFVLVPKVGRGGLIGFLKARNSTVWFFMCLQAAVVASVVSRSIRPVAGHPFCESCAVWYQTPFNVSVTPVAFGDPLATAIENESIEEILAVRSVGEDIIADNVAVARVYRCPKCGRQLCDVILKYFRPRATTSVRLTPHQISSEVYTALTAKLPVEVPNIDPNPIASTAVAREQPEPE